MSRRGLEGLIGKALSDENFLEGFLKDPEGVVKKMGLARISHQISAASVDFTSSAASDLVGHTQRTVKYASYGLGRLPCIQSELAALVTKSDEKCGLDISSEELAQVKQVDSGKVRNFARSFAQEFSDRRQAL